MTSVSVISIILVGHFSWPQALWTSFGSEVRSLTVPLKFFTEGNRLKGCEKQVEHPHRQLTSSPAPGELSIFEALQILVDLGETPFQMATAVRAVRPEAPDWFHLVALIHDLGKMMALPQLAGKEWMGSSDIWLFM